MREDKSAKDVHIESLTVTQESKKKSAPAATAKSKTFKITHPERVLYPKQKITKMDVALYYKSVSPWLLPHTANRPLSLLRCHDTAGENCFFQKHLDIANYSSLFEASAKEQKINYLKNEAGLLDLVQMGVLELHTWQAHVDDTTHPDQIILDLDPDEKVSWSDLKKTAFRFKELLEKLDLKSTVKTTGGKGLHIHVSITPKYSWEQVKAFSKSLCMQLESEFPDLYITKSTKKKRTKKIYLDYLRNGFGATAIAPYSLRARTEPTVATPITWEELQAAKTFIKFDIKTVLKRLATQNNDPWPKKLKQKLKIFA